MAALRETSVVFAAARGAVFPGRRWGVRGPPAPSWSPAVRCWWDCP